MPTVPVKASLEWVSDIQNFISLNIQHMHILHDGEFNLDCVIRVAQWDVSGFNTFYKVHKPHLGS
jgi:hypothetical protein